MKADKTPRFLPTLITLLLPITMFAVLVALAAAPAVALDGAELYRDCAACHGKDGGGVADGSVPAIGGQPAAVIMRQLERFRSGERQDLRMRHFSDDQHLEGAPALEAVARHIAALQRRTKATTGAGNHLTEGARDFAARCAGCHGANASAVVALGVPALAGQHAPYLVRKLRDSAAPNGLGRNHATLVVRLAPPQIEGIADWLSRLPPPAP